MHSEHKTLFIKHLFSGNKKYQIAMVFFIGLLSFYFIYNICGLNNPFKITDPKNSYFKLSEFNIADYGTGEKLDAALVKMFPVGTPRHIVDTVMIIGGAKPTQDPQEKYLVYYTYMARFSWYFDPKRTYRFIYDSNQNLLNIHLPTGQKLFKDSKGIKEIRNEDN